MIREEEIELANYKYTKTITEKITVKGELSADGLSITYFDKDEGEIVVNVADCLKPFYGEEITFSIAVKDEQEIED